MRDFGQRVIQCDESALEECLEGFVVIFANERVSVSFCDTTKIFEKSHDGSIVIIEQTRW